MIAERRIVQRLIVLAVLFPAATMAAAPDRESAPPAPPQAQATLANPTAPAARAAAPRRRAASPRADARNCLHFTENAAVRRCAEQYR